MRHFIRSAVVAIAMATASTFTLSAALAADISGAGSTFIYPVFAKWADTYKTDDQHRPQLPVDRFGRRHQAGQRQDRDLRRHRQADDATTTDKNGLVQFPMVMGGIVPVVNIDGVKPGELVLDGQTLAEIFLGKITTWDDAGDQGAEPDADPAVARRSPSCTAPTARARPSTSPTTWSRSVAGLEGQGRRRTPRSNGRSASAPRATKALPTPSSRPPARIGYVEYAYAKQNNLTYTKMINAAGKAVEPTLDSLRPPPPMPTGQGQELQPDHHQPAGRRAWPIAAVDLGPDPQAARTMPRPPVKR